MRWPPAALLLAAGAGVSATGVPGLSAQHLPAPPGLAAYLERQVDSAFPGGVLVVGHRGELAVVHAFGRHGMDDPRPVEPSTVYDLASLTKVVGLTSAVMLLVASGELDLDRPVQAYVPEFRGGGKHEVLVRHLLQHTSGLPAWRPLFRETQTRRDALDTVFATPLDTAPGYRYVYSDLGAIVLTQVVERVARESLDSLLAREIFTPLDMTDTRFRPPIDDRSRIAPTEHDPWRGRVLRGEVHDENAARLGGVSGHAGLFSTGTDLARFAFWMLDAYHDRIPDGRVPAIPSSVVRAFVRRQSPSEESTRALGWDTPSERNSSAGNCLSRTSFGHLGFTGTSIWIDPVEEVVIILLTNRVHPSRDNTRIRRVRPAVADLAARALGTCRRGAEPAPGGRVDTLPGRL